MTVERSPLAFRCDGACGTSVDEDDAGVEGFEELLDAIKADGWAVNQMDGQWFHLCPDCQ